MGEERRSFEIPAHELPFSPSRYLLGRLTLDEREQVLRILAEIGAGLRQAAEEDEAEG